MRPFKKKASNNLREETIRNTKGINKTKQRITVAFFVSTDGGKVGKPIIIWKSKKPRCFKRANAASKPGHASYFADAKSWMQIDIMEKVLQKLNNIMKLENRKILWFLDNPLVHPETWRGNTITLKLYFIRRTQLQVCSH